MYFKYIYKNNIRERYSDPFSPVKTCPQKTNKTASKGSFRVKIHIMKFSENNI